MYTSHSINLIPPWRISSPVLLGYGPGKLYGAKRTPGISGADGGENRVLKRIPRKSKPTKLCPLVGSGILKAHKDGEGENGFIGMLDCLEDSFLSVSFHTLCHTLEVVR